MKRKKYETYRETKKHTSADFPYNTYLCSIPLDFKSVKIHWHDEVELIVIKKGEGIVSVDLTKYHVKAGDVVLVMSGQLHSISQFQNSAMEYENILFRPTMLKSSENDLCWENYISPIVNGTKSVPDVLTADSSIHTAVSECIDSIDELCDKKPVGYQLAVKGNLFLMFYQLATADLSDTTARRKQLDKIKVVLAYVEEHYPEEMTIEQMAELCFYSKSYFMKFFKESMGVSFVAYLNDHRLEAAARLLHTSDENIIDIASRCGFDNLSYFNRSFKKKYGITPGKYRG